LIRSHKKIENIVLTIFRICNGILFKFALDVPLKGGTYIYGGAEKNDEKAMKSACNERKGLLVCFDSLHI
jgi:hypothetical protein